MIYHYKSDKKIAIVISAFVIVMLLGLAFSSGLTGMFMLETNNTVLDEAGNAQSAGSESVAEAIKPVCTDVEEKHYEIEPYEEEQCLNVPKTETLCDAYDVKYILNKECYWSPDFKTLNVICDIKNVDSVRALFKIDVGIATKDGKVSEEMGINLSPQESHGFTYEYNTDMGSCICNMTYAPTKELCYDSVSSKQECFNVTKYRQAEKTKFVERCE